MKVFEIEGMAIGRIANPAAVRKQTMRTEMNGAYREIVQEIRDADTDVADTVDEIDLRADTNLYQVPSVDSIRRVERFDLTSSLARAVPCSPIPFARLGDYFGRPAYAIGPEGFYVAPTPVADWAKGLRVASLPVAEELTNDEQVPRLPEPLHDALAARTVRRLLSISGIEAADEKMVGDWIGTQQKYLISWLNPAGHEAVTRLQPGTSLYRRRGF